MWDDFYYQFFFWPEAKVNDFLWETILHKFKSKLFEQIEDDDSIFVMAYSSPIRKWRHVAHSDFRKFDYVLRMVIDCGRWS